MINSLIHDPRETVARHYVAEVFTGANAERARDYFTADIAWHGGALGTVTGRRHRRPRPRRLHRRPVGHPGDRAGRDRERRPGRPAPRRDGDPHRQPARGPGDRTPVRWDAVDIYRVTDDGRISEQWAFEDLAAILSQVGAIALPWAG